MYVHCVCGSGCWERARCQGARAPYVVGNKRPGRILLCCARSALYSVMSSVQGQGCSCSAKPNKCSGGVRGGVVCQIKRERDDQKKRGRGDDAACDDDQRREKKEKKKKSHKIVDRDQSANDSSFVRSILDLQPCKLRGGGRQNETELVVCRSSF